MNDIGIIIFPAKLSFRNELQSKYLYVYGAILLLLHSGVYNLHVAFVPQGERKVHFLIRDVHFTLYHNLCSL